MADANHTTKRCTVCSEEKPTIEFGKRSAANDGLRSQCKACDAIARRKYAETNQAKIKGAAAKWRAENAEYRKQKLAEWRASNPEKIKLARKRWEAANPGRVAELNKQWNDANREKIADRNAAHYAANREYFAEANKRWRKDNPEAARVITRRAKAARKGAAGSFTKDDIDRLQKLQHGKCCYCREPLRGKYHIDHIMPVSKGGSNDPSNLQLLCPPCNQSKKDKLPEDFARRMGYLI